LGCDSVSRQTNLTPPETPFSGSAASFSEMPLKAPRACDVESRYPPCHYAFIGGAIIAPTRVPYEVSMLGRRSHARVSLESGAEGLLSVARDISVRVTDEGHFIATSRDAGVLGERVRVLLPDRNMDVVVEIVESRPMITDGAVRHRLLMRPLGRDVGGTASGRR
jgi:hypothetical protein